MPIDFIVETHEFIIIWRLKKKIVSFQSNLREAPFSYEPEAIDEAKQCDYLEKITVEMAKEGKGNWISLFWIEKCIWYYIFVFLTLKFT